MTQIQIYTLLAGLSVAIILFYEVRFFISIFKNHGFLNRWLIVVLTILLGCTLLLTWPGIIGGDDFYLIKALTNAPNISAFSGALYSGLVNLLLHLNFEIYLLPALQILLFITLFSKALFQIDTLLTNERVKMAWLYKFLTLLFFISPLAISFAVFQNRDSLFSILFCHVVFHLIISLNHKEGFFSIERNFFYFLTLALFTLNLRQDALVNVLTLPLLVFLTSRFINRRKFIFYSLLYLVVSGLLSIPLFSTNTSTQLYRSTSVINPVSYIINKYGMEVLSPRESNDFEKVFKLDYIIKYYSPLEIDPFHKGGSNLNATIEDYNVFFEICFRLFSEHKIDFLKNRINVFLHGINLTKTIYFNGDATDSVAKEVGLSEKYLLASGRQTVLNKIKDIVYYVAITNSVTRILFFNLVPHFLLFLFLILNLKNFAAEIWVISWIFLRLPILFLLEPASIFKYYYAIYFSFVFVVIHLVFKHRGQNRQT